MEPALLSVNIPELPSDFDKIDSSFDNVEASGNNKKVNTVTGDAARFRAAGTPVVN